MFSTRRRREVPTLNTTSTADISFMLLIFFLVTSSMDTDKGLLRQMPPPPEEHLTMDVRQEHVLQVTLDAANQLTCNGDTVTPEQLSARVELFVSGDRAEHIIAVKTDRAATFDAYFQMQRAIVAAYQELRNEYARKHFGHALKNCTPAEREAAADYWKQRVSETVDVIASGTEKGGRP